MPTTDFQTNGEGACVRFTLNPFSSLKELFCFSVSGGSVQGSFCIGEEFYLRRTVSGVLAGFI